ncbi:hypothetical protein ACIF80_36615 [Streptomyces sp. NPDC085927]|uniref:hypothetical protein n=1 Tax=Streptomyces sp. NPDC085927 TaxID=3365738 RepID=UPI0037D3C3C9
MDLNSSIAAAQERMGRRWADQINETLAAALPSWRTGIDDAVEALARAAAQQVQALHRIDLSFDTTGLNRVLQDVEAWQVLDAEQRMTASRLLDDAYQTAEASSADEVPDDLVANLAETARSFAASQDGFLTPERQRQLLVYFCGLLMLAALMQASFTSEAADAVIEKTMALSPAAVLTMAVAGKAWDKHVRRPEDEEASSEEGDTDTQD